MFLSCKMIATSIKAILIVNIFKSSEGIIFVTDKTQYGFFKDNMWLDEHVVIIEDEENALSKVESLKEHYDISGYPYNGKCKRSPSL